MHCRRRSQHVTRVLTRRIAWRVQAIAEGDLSERAKARAGELARDADLRLVPPPDPPAPGEAGRVTMHTVFGGHRIVDMLVGEQLPRIC